MFRKPDFFVGIRTKHIRTSNAPSVLFKKRSWRWNISQRVYCEDTSVKINWQILVRIELSVQLCNWVYSEYAYAFKLSVQQFQEERNKCLVEVRSGTLLGLHFLSKFVNIAYSLTLLRFLVQLLRNKWRVRRWVGVTLIILYSINSILFHIYNVMSMRGFAKSFRAFLSIVL